MGAETSRQYEYEGEYGRYNVLLDSLETESITRVCNKLLDPKFRSEKQMEALSVSIYEKAVSRPDLSLKFAQLVKKLKSEMAHDNGQIVHFRAVFDEHFLNMVTLFATRHDDRLLDQNIKERGKNIGTFLGHLYNIDFYTLEPIVEVAQVLKNKKTPMFMDNLLSVIESKMKEENVTIEKFNEMVDRDNMKITKYKIDPKADALGYFSAFLHDLKDKKKYKNYQKFHNLEIIDQEAQQIEVAMVFKQAYEDTNFLCIYRDIMLKMYIYQPGLILENIRTEFNGIIERIDYPLNDERYQHVGNMIIELYNVNLIEDDVLEYFLDTLMKSDNAETVFAWTFIDALKKYDGSKTHDFFCYLNYLGLKIKPLKDLINPVQLHIHQKVSKKASSHKKEKHIETGAAYCSDLKEHSVKRVSYAATFKCADKPSCHFGALRSIDILMRHIGHSFFTPEHIEACTAMTKNMLKIPSKARISEKFEREMQTFLLYFHNDIEPDLKVKNFSNLVTAFYEAGILRHEAVEKWLLQIHGVLKTKMHKFHGKLMDIYRPSFMRIFNNFLHDSPHSWLLHSTFIDDCDFATSPFEEFGKFKGLIEFYQKETEFSYLGKMEKVKIPNERLVMKQISKYILDFYVEAKTRPTYPATIFLLLSGRYRPQLDKDILREEFQEALCNKIAYLCSICNKINSQPYFECQLLFHVINLLCLKSSLTRLGLVSILSVMGNMIDKHPYPVRDLILIATEKLGKFFYGAKAIPVKVEYLMMEVGRKVIQSFEADLTDCEKATDILTIFKEIVEDSKKKREAESFEMFKLSESTKAKLRGMAKVNRAYAIANANKIKEKEKVEKIQAKVNGVKENEAGSSSSSSSSSSPSNLTELNGTTSEEVTTNASIQPNVPLEDCKQYSEYFNYFNSIASKTFADDQQLFDPALINNLEFNKKEQVVNFCGKFIDRFMANKNHVLFFVQSALKIAKNEQDLPKNCQFRKILVDEIMKKFQNEKALVELMSELYNNNFVNKASMVAFVEKFKTQRPKHLELLQTFVRICGLKLANQGDKQQLVQIRNIARTIKSSSGIDDNSKFIAQDLASSLSSVISLIENGQIKIQNLKIHDLDESMNDEEFSAVLNMVKSLNESTEKVAEDLIQKALKSPQIAAKAASKFDGKIKTILLQKCQNLLKEVPDITCSSDEILNIMEFSALLHNLKIFKNEFMIWAVELFLKSSTDKLCCQLLYVVLEKCGAAMETSNKSKLDVYFKFFEAVLAENEESVRSKYFKKFIKLRSSNWKVFIPSKNFYEDFLMLYSINDSNIEELNMHLMYDDDEVDKFIQILWKVLLKEAPHPSHVNLCSELSKSCSVFAPKLTAFLTARCKTFNALADEFYSEDVKHRLGKVVTFAAEIYDKNLLTDELLEMWIDLKLVKHLSIDFRARIFTILGCSKRVDASSNLRMKTLAANIENAYFEDMNERVKYIVDDLKGICNRSV